MLLRQDNKLSLGAHLFIQKKKPESLSLREDVKKFCVYFGRFVEMK